MYSPTLKQKNTGSMKNGNYDSAKLRSRKIKDKITKESELLEKILRYIEYPSEYCPYDDCDSFEVGVIRKIGDKRTRRCLKCGRDYRTLEKIVKLG